MIINPFILFQCNNECKHMRQVICQDHRGQRRDECPKELEPLHIENCCQFKWRAIWKPVSPPSCV